MNKNVNEKINNQSTEGKKYEVLLTVIMSVYNSEKYVSYSIDSILNQTFSDFEFLITDDASTDESIKIIEKYNDKRIRVIKNEERKGLTKNLNNMIRNAKGKYIARMDADDISESNRFEQEISLLEQDDRIQMVCSYSEIFGEHSSICRTPQNYELLRATLLVCNPITHSSVMFRNCDSHMYNEIFFKSQDYELWDRMSERKELIKVIPSALIKYREHESQSTKKHSEEEIDLLESVYIRALERVGICLNAFDKKRYATFCRCGHISEYRDFVFLYNIFSAIQRRNKKTKEYNKLALLGAMENPYKVLLLYCIRNINAKLLCYFVLLGIKLVRAKIISFILI